MMQLYSHIAPLSIPKDDGCVIALGYFDGLHIGHHAVIQTAVDWANMHGLHPALFTFELPKKNSLKGDRLMSIADKHVAIEAMGITHYIEPTFAEIKDDTPEDFVNQLIDVLQARALVCGENFRFGAKAAGDVSLLQTLCAARGVKVFVVPLTKYQGEVVSSTRIRAALCAGDISAVNAMLGVAYTIHFEVQHGRGLGRTLGVPTMNQIYPAGFQMPKFGIYITRTCIDGVWYPSATGLGSRPTVNEDTSSITCETFIPNFTGDLYGAAPVLEFHQYLCESKKFNSLEELKACIQGAAAATLAYFAEASC